MSLRTSEMRIIIAGDAASYLRTMAEVSAATDATATGMGTQFEKSTSKVGGFFENLGSKMQSWGLPFGKAVSDMGTKLDGAGSKASKLTGVMSDLGKVSLGVGAVAFAGIAAESVRLAMGFQQAMTQVVTGAGELPQNLKADETAIENMAGHVGQTTSELAKAFYTINSAGFHGAAGLSVLKASAEGAAVGNAQLGTVADATTTVLKAYGLSAGKSVSVVNQMIATEKVGKSHMQDLAGSLSAVLPIAAVSHLSFAQVGGAIATMTAQGMSADQTTQDLAHAIRALENPNSVAVTEMQQMGLSSNNVAKNLGKRGLTGTLDLLTGTILKNMGPSGEVMLKAFNQSKAASSDLQIMLGAMNPKMRGLAKEFESGALTVSQFRKALPTNEQGVIQQFASLYANAHGFNTMLKSGQPAAQTFQAALAKVTGGATGMNVALMLGGSHTATFAQNVKLIGDAATHSGKHVTDFNVVQKTLAFQMSQAKDTLDGLAVSFGMMLIPWIEKAGRAISSFVGWLQKNKIIAEVLGGVIAGVLVTAIGIYIGGLALAVVRTAASFAQMAAKGVVWAASNVATMASWVATTAVSVAQSVALWVMYAAEWLASTAASAATFIATHVAMAASFIAENTAMIASATAAFVAENAATLGIIAGIGLLIGAIVYLATHWKAVWHDIKAWALDAWNFLWREVFQPIGNWFSSNVTPIVKSFSGLWTTVWKGIKVAVSDAWGIIKPIFDAISTGLKDIGGAAKAIGGFFSSIFGGGGSSGGSAPSITRMNVPHAAAGGLVTRPTLLLAGEAGPEMIVPLNKGGGMSLQQPGALPTGAAASGTLSINYAPHVFITGTTEQMTQQVQKMLDEHSQELADRIAAHAA